MFSPPLRTGPAVAQPEDDRLWQESFDVVLEPNPELTEGQRRGVALDYGMAMGSSSSQCATHFSTIFSKRLRFDVGEALDSPHERPVIIRNRPGFRRCPAEGHGPREHARTRADEQQLAEAAGTLEWQSDATKRLIAAGSSPGAARRFAAELNWATKSGH